MRKIVILFLLVIISFSTNAQIIHLDSAEYFSPYVFGHNLEHCRAAINGGLSAQMLKNRKFAGKPQKNGGAFSPWFRIGDKVFLTESAAYTKHICLKRMKRNNELRSQSIENLIEGKIAGIGQRDLCLTAGTTYQLRTVTKVSSPVKLNIEFTNRKGDKIYARHDIELKPENDWAINEFEMTSPIRDTDACIRYTYFERAKLTIGALSLMPKDNFHGMRKDVVEELKAIGPRLLRWPGGNFSGEYRWEDGILPADERGPLYAYDPAEQQPFTNGFDFHEIGTDDFIALCREVGAEPYLTINIAWNTPEESANWVEYCNGSASTEYGRKRAENGHPEPYNVKFWSLGNELGHADEHMEGPNKIDEYTRIASEHADAMLKVTPELELFSSGPYPNDEWVKKSAVLLSDRVKYYSQHAYSGNSYDYVTDEGIRKSYEKTICHAIDFRNLSRQMRDCLGIIGGKDLHISFDEWNQWYAWNRPSSVMEGILAIRTMHMFITESNTLDIPVVCYFQPVGEGAIEISPEETHLTATGQMFSMLKEHQDGKMCKIEKNEDYSTVATLKSDTLTVTMVNYLYDEERKFDFNLKGNVIMAESYNSKEITPYSYFDKSNLQINQTKKNVSMTLPPHSAAIFKIKIKKSF